MDKKGKKIIVAISGGVDSAVSALLLKNQGYEVIGVFMRLGHFGAKSEAAARAVCRHLNIKFYPLNISDSFKSEVVEYFIETYSRGLTPNPCIKCNKLIKFGAMMQVMRDLGADYLATGHYASSLSFPAVAKRRGRPARRAAGGESTVCRDGSMVKRCDVENEIFYKLYRAKDSKKDQTYFLYHLTQEQLKHIIFPLSEMTKEEVRLIAVEAGLPFIESESQDICFMQDEKGIIDHNELLKEHLDLEPGDIVWLKKVGDKRAEQIVGRHKGLPLYTIGQRRGIEVGGIGPFYAAEMDYAKNILYVVDSADDEILFRDSFELCDVSWVAGLAPEKPLDCEAVIRYRHAAVSCTVHSAEGGRVKVALKKPQRAIMPGQSVVFYDGDEVLGGGIVA